jgi:hypothetical protein
MKITVKKGDTTHATLDATSAATSMLNLGSAVKDLQTRLGEAGTHTITVEVSDDDATAVKELARKVVQARSVELPKPQPSPKQPSPK